MYKIRAAHNRLSFLRFKKENAQVARTVKRIEKEKLSYHDLGELCDLSRVALDNEKQNIEGIVIEAGCALGGSAIALATAKSKSRPFCIYDVFGMPPPPSDKDDSEVQERYTIIASGKSQGIGGNHYYGYEKDVYSKVLQNFANFNMNPKEHNVFFVKGLFQDTLHINTPVSFAHIDCDWYDSVLTCLNRIEPHLVKGGTLAIGYYWSSCRRAVHDYFANKNQNDYHYIKNNILYYQKVNA